MIPASSMKASNCAVVTTKPGGTGMPAEVMVTSEAPLPPRFSSFGSMPPSKNWMYSLLCMFPGLPGDGDGLGDAEGEVLAEGDGFRMLQLQLRGEPGHFLEGDLGLELGEHVAQAVVDAEPEGQVLAGVGAGDVEVLAGVELGLVPVGRAHEEQQLRAFGDGDAADFGVLEGLAAPADDRAGVAQDLVDGGGDFLRVLHQLLPLLGAGQEFAERVGDQRGGGLVAGEEQAVDRRRRSRGRRFRRRPAAL